MTLAQRQRPYKALTYIHLPVVEKDYRPGDLVEIEDLVAAGQTDEDIENLTKHGSLGDEGDDIHPSHIVPDPSIPTIQSVVADARRTVEELKAAGEKVPKELKAVADLDYEAVSSGDSGRSVDKNE